MKYLNPNGEWPRYAGDIQLEHPTWNIGDALPAGWHIINDVAQPEAGEDEVAEITGVQEIDGEFFDLWTIRPLTSEELAERAAFIEMMKAKLAELGPSES